MATERKAVVAVTRTADGISIKVNGDQRAPITLAFSQCNSAVLDEALGYGMEVRLTRQAALEANGKTGLPAPASAKYDAIKRLADWYGSGQSSWRMPGGGGGGLSADTQALCEALMRAFGLGADAAEEAVRGMSGAERDALRVDPEVKPALDAVYAERAKARGAIDTKALIGKLKAR